MKGSRGKHRLTVNNSIIYFASLRQITTEWKTDKTEKSNKDEKVGLQDKANKNIMMIKQKETFHTGGNSIKRQNTFVLTH